MNTLAGDFNGRMNTLIGELNLNKWMLATSIALTITILLKLFLK
ncbi:hypothetical protein [Acidovorax sp. sic0104]|nr:hypothetical protein [Acidovorax sp. sic0104]